MTRMRRIAIDWALFAPALLLSVLGLVTMYDEQRTAFFAHQLLWIALGAGVGILIARTDMSFLKRRSAVVALFALALLLLTLVLFVGVSVKGAQSRFSFGGFAVQPSEFAKLSLLLLLAKYFTRRHIEIAQFRHLIISGIYTAIPFILILLQPDFGSAVMLLAIWGGILLVSGISKKQLAFMFAFAVISGALLWQGVLQPYQKQRILTFLHPLQDIYGSGYNAYQSVIAVGSGGLFGKGIGFGTQSKLRFLPEYQTDFIFASFAEEWGFVGVLLLFTLFALLLGRLLFIAAHTEDNFEKLFAAGLFSLFLAHFTIHVGMNMGSLPVTGITLPFLSYGGSHMLIEFVALGIASSFSRTSRAAALRQPVYEFVGGETRLHSG